MKKYLFAGAAVVLLTLFAPIVFSATSVGRANTNVTDIYELRMRLKIPAIIDNMESQGRRKYKSQLFYGELRIHYTGKDGDYSAEISIPALTNRSYKIRDNCVTYRTEITGYPIWSAIGDNKTGVFNKATLAFGINADPSYNVGDDEPDNTLILTLSLIGNQFGRMSGYAAGQLGCGCHAYGHVSPTRAIGPNGATDNVVDIAAVNGTVYLKYRGYVDD